jgi:hypothetical protein
MSQVLFSGKQTLRWRFACRCPIGKVLISTPLRMTGAQAGAEGETELACSTWGDLSGTLWHWGWFFRSAVSIPRRDVTLGRTMPSIGLRGSQLGSISLQLSLQSGDWALALLGDLHPHGSIHHRVRAWFLSCFLFPISFPSPRSLI